MLSEFNSISRMAPAPKFGLVLLLLCAVAPWTPAIAYQMKTIHTFCSKRGCTDGGYPSSALTMDSAGNLYGVTGESGQLSTVFELIPSADGQTWKSKALAHCREIRGNLIIDISGSLYGTNDEGGARNAGEVIELVAQPGKTKRKCKSLYSFQENNFSDGAYPIGGLTYSGAASGTPYDGTSPLYGTTFEGGTSAEGTVYQLTPTGGSWTESVLYSFCSQGGCTDGARPFAALIVDGTGNLYGTTADGGGYGYGNAFELVNEAGLWTESVLHDFCQAKRCTDGASPLFELLMDGTGNLYGSARGPFNRQEGGFVFQLVPNGSQSQYSVIYDFCSRKDCRDGAEPVGSVIMDNDGNIFGVTQTGGGHDIDDAHLGGGVVFELSGSTLTALYTFCAQKNCEDGEYPPAGLIKDSKGNLFGTTQQGGKYGEGTVFELIP